MMRIGLMLVGLLFMGMTARAQDVTPPMKADFLAKVKTAVTQKDYKAFSRLYSPSGTVDPAIKPMLDKMSQDFFDKIAGMASPDFEFGVPPATQPTSFAYQGKTYEPNVKVVLMLQVHDLKVAPNTPGMTSMAFPVGVEHDSLVIAQTVLKP